MNEAEPDYYLAAGRSLAELLEWRTKATRVSALREAFVRRFPGATLWGTVNNVYGLQFDGKPACDLSYWRKTQPRRDVYAPRMNSKAGKAINAELRSMGLESCFPRLSKIMGNKMWNAGFEQFGERFVILARAGMTPPDDAIPLKASDYWRMREEKDAAAVVAK